MPNSSFGLSFYHTRLLIILFLVMVVVFFDFLIFWDFSQILSQYFFADNQNNDLKFLSISTFIMAGYVARPFGGFLLGRISDNQGRLKAFFMALFGISLFSFVIGLLPSYEKIGIFATALFIIARIAQGIFFGAITPIAWVYVTESLPLRQIGLGAGVVCSGAVFGVLAASISNATLSELLSQENFINYGFKMPFIISGLLGFLLLFSKKYLTESPIFIQKKSEHSSTEHELPYQKIEILEMSHKKLPNVLKGMMPLLVFSGFIISITIFNVLLAPLLDVGFVHGGNDFFGIGMLFSLFFYGIGCIFFGFITDRITISRALVIGCSGLVLSSWAFFNYYTSDPDFALLFLILLGFFSGVVATVPAAMVRLTPFRHRTLKFAVTYNIVSAILGAGLPILLGMATYYANYAPVIYLGLVCMMTIFYVFVVHYLPRSEQQLYS